MLNLGEMSKAQNNNGFTANQLAFLNTLENIKISSDNKTAWFTGYLTENEKPAGLIFSNLEHEPLTEEQV